MVNLSMAVIRLQLGVSRSEKGIRDHSVGCKRERGTSRQLQSMSARIDACEGRALTPTRYRCQEIPPQRYRITIRLTLQIPQYPARQVHDVWGLGVQSMMYLGAVTVVLGAGT